MAGGVKIYPFPGDSNFEICVPYYDHLECVFLSEAYKHSNTRRVKCEELTANDKTILANAKEKAFQELIKDNYNVMQ